MAVVALQRCYPRLQVALAITYRLVPKPNAEVPEAVVAVVETQPALWFRLKAGTAVLADTPEGVAVELAAGPGSTQAVLEAAAREVQVLQVCYGCSGRRDDAYC